VSALVRCLWLGAILTAGDTTPKKTSSGSAASGWAHESGGLRGAMNNPRSNKGRKPIAVSRDYKPAPGSCVRALVTLLESSVNKKADKPAPEPDGCNDAAIVRNMEGGESCRAAPR
jgi:hypothetical protein